MTRFVKGCITGFDYYMKLLVINTAGVEGFTLVYTTVPLGLIY
ncbi:hypothetical protein [Pseudoalteromonas obscura]|nr:hypothetical protein [Pseudoalteromonas sp. P94(2023)]